MWRALSCRELLEFVEAVMVLLVGLTGAFSTHAATAIAPAIVAVLRTNLCMVFSWTCVEWAGSRGSQSLSPFSPPCNLPRVFPTNAIEGLFEVRSKHEHQVRVACPVRRGCLRFVTETRAGDRTKRDTAARASPSVPIRSADSERPLPAARRGRPYWGPELIGPFGGILRSGRIWHQRAAGSCDSARKRTVGQRHDRHLPRTRQGSPVRDSGTGIARQFGLGGRRQAG